MARSYTIVVEADGSEVFKVSVPALPGCFTQGRTIDECRERAAEAIAAHIAGLQADGRPVPSEVSPPQLFTVTVAA
ncbi:MAG: type II toxin-antitoxin system HicB family antitoxin [Candidatus Dormibacteraeota bacterium]|nr:type II toxin-antitoxin system HicB family antitoxin [Candidatus Dormibacteraeota bacterium]